MKYELSGNFRVSINIKSHKIVRTLTVTVFASLLAIGIDLLVQISFRQFPLAFLTQSLPKSLITFFLQFPTWDGAFALIVTWI